MELNASSFLINNKHKIKKKKPKLKKNALDKVDFEEEKRNDPKYKTELCKTFMENNFCQYGNKCRFAHGEEELVIKAKISNYKRKLCKSFFNEGFCPYGIRCNFQHDQRKFTDIKLHFYYINLLIYRKPKLITGKRLKIFEEIISMDNILSESTLSSSIDNSPNNKKEENYKGNSIEKNVSNFFQIDNFKKLNLDINLEFNKNCQQEEEIKNNNKYNISPEKTNLENNIYNSLFNIIDGFEGDYNLDKRDKE